MSEIKLIDITKENWVKICYLRPGKEGVQFVASNSFSIAQSVYEEGWIIKGIDADGTLIGFTMYGYDEEVSGYELCRFMIDEKYQGKGYGTKALEIIIAEMFSKFDCEKIYLSTDPSNARGIHIYTKAGFVSTGRLIGDDEDAEELFCLDRINH